MYLRINTARSDARCRWHGDRTVWRGMTATPVGSEQNQVQVDRQESKKGNAVALCDHLSDLRGSMGYLIVRNAPVLQRLLSAMGAVTILAAGCTAAVESPSPERTVQVRLDSMGVHGVAPLQLGILMYADGPASCSCPATWWVPIRRAFAELAAIYWLNRVERASA